MKWQGRVFKMRHVPCAWHNPNAVLALGPGAVVDPDYLFGDELPELRRAGMNIDGRFWIDPMCAVITEQDRREGKGRIARIGATGKGVGDATARRVLRSGRIARDHALLQPYLRDVGELVREWHLERKPIIVESAQGYALSLTRSGFYPYATSRDVTPPAILNDAGIPLCGDVSTIMLLRTYPIRVAGPSGPLAFETTWEKLGEATEGYIQPELTTVTQKVRRVGLWDEDLAKKAVMACRPDFIALTFFDYWRPDLANQTVLDADAYARIEVVEKALGVPVAWVSTGFQSITTIRRT
jgi:adenylosuccinate synthase